MQIRALREVEPWTGPSIAAGIILLVVVLALLFWAVRRYLKD